MVRVILESPYAGGCKPAVYQTLWSDDLTICEVQLPSGHIGRGNCETAALAAAMIARNRKYLTECLRDSLLRGEAPFASHAIYTQALDDTIPSERELGIMAGFEWGDTVNKVVVYIDLGVSSGMRQGIEAALARGADVEYRRLHVPSETGK